MTRHTALVLSILALSACGGSTDSESTGGAGRSGASGASGGSGGAGASGGIGGAGNAAGAAGAGGTGSAQSGGTGGGGIGGAAGASGAGGVAGEPGVECGGAVCQDPAFCLVCDPTNPSGTKSCETALGNDCVPWGQYPPLRMSCDGQEDCTAAEACLLFEGGLGTYTKCMPTPNGFGGNIVCQTPAECPPATPSCEPYNVASYLVKVCN